MELFEIIDKHCQDYTGKKMTDAWDTIQPAMMRKILERSMTEYHKLDTAKFRAFTKEVGKMREAQKNYFQNRTETNLNTAKQWERHIDKEVSKRENEAQLTIF